MQSHGTVEHFQSFDVNVLRRMGALRETLVSCPMVSFRWPALARLSANKWRVDVEFRGGVAQCIRLIWTLCHFGAVRRRAPECRRHSRIFVRQTAL